MHGEAGLRERFVTEIASFPDDDRRRAERALELAARLHAGDRRQREPYVNHLLRVSIRIITYYGIRHTDVICAALLHDAVEDHARELAAGGGQQAALAALAEQFGSRVAELVAAVTNPPHEPGRDRHEQYREHVAASLQANPWARVIKASDFTDNGVGLIHTTGHDSKGSPTSTRHSCRYSPSSSHGPTPRCATTPKHASSASSTAPGSGSQQSNRQRSPLAHPADHAYALARY